MSDAVITLLLLHLRLQESSVSESITKNRFKYSIKMKIHNELHKSNNATCKIDFLHVNQTLCTRFSIECYFKSNVRSVQRELVSKHELYAFLECMSPRNSCRVSFQDLRHTQHTVFAFYSLCPFGNCIF